MSNLNKVSYLTFIKNTANSKGLYKCACGNYTEILNQSFKSKNTASCGCLARKTTSIRATSHGLSKHPIFSVFRNIKTRCYKESNKDYKDYGGRGIIICSEWKNDFTSFYNWCIENGWQRGLQIDRINNNGNYEPANCRIVEPIINANNRSSCRFIELNGQIKSLSDWCRFFKLNRQTVTAKLNRGVDKYIAFEIT